MERSKETQETEKSRKRKALKDELNQQRGGRRNQK